MRKPISLPRWVPKPKPPPPTTYRFTRFAVDQLRALLGWPPTEQQRALEALHSIAERATSHGEDSNYHQLLRGRIPVSLSQDIPERHRSVTLIVSVVEGMLPEVIGVERRGVPLQRGFLRPVQETIEIECHVCHAGAIARVSSGIARWYQLPAGWWSLGECLDLVVRCPKCTS